jgi:hypothetical protein
MTAKIFISPRTADLAGGYISRKTPGSYHKVARVEHIAFDRTLEIGYVVKLFDRDHNLIGVVSCETPSAPADFLFKAGIMAPVKS